MDKQEFFEAVVSLFEWLQQTADNTNARTAHVKYELPSGGHMYFEVRRPTNGSK